MKKTFQKTLIGAAIGNLLLSAGAAVAGSTRRFDDLNPVSLITIGDGTDTAIGGGGEPVIGGLDTEKKCDHSGRGIQAGIPTSQHHAEIAATTIPTGDRQQEWPLSSEVGGSGKALIHEG